MTADKAGVFKVDIDARREISEAIRRSLKEPKWEYSYDYKTRSYEEYDIAKDFAAVQRGEYVNEFSIFIDSVKRKRNLSAIDSLLIQYFQSPINSDGFRSIEFKKVNSKRPSVLLLGDSYVWGHKTKNKTNSFADLLLSQGYVVYNSGIGGTDPPQYLQIARKYISILKPDFVIVNFNLSNDVQYFERKMIPFRPVMWITNAGYLMSCPEGVYFSDFNQAYNLSIENCVIPQTNNFNKICSRSVLSTLFWSALSKHYLLASETARMKEYKRRVNELRDTIPYSNGQIKEIKEICGQNEAKFILAVIPEIYYADGKPNFDYGSHFPNLLIDINTFSPHFPENYYSPEDGHFNDLGHQKYAQFLSQIMDSIQRSELKPESVKNKF